MFYHCHHHIDNSKLKQYETEKDKICKNAKTKIAFFPLDFSDCKTLAKFSLV